jgi:LppX_LprAFG lipoprotein
MRRLIALTAALLAAAALALAGCGGGGSGTDKTKGLDAAGMLAGSKQAAAGQTSYRVKFTATVQITGSNGSIPDVLAGALKKPLHVSGEGRIDGDNASIDLTVPLAGIPLQLNVTKVGGGLYATILGQDYKLPVSQQRVSAIQPSKLISTLLGWLENPQIVGQEKVDGVEAVRLRASVDATKAVPDVASLVGAATGPVSPAALAKARSQATAALKRGDAEVWIAKATLLPVRIVANIRLSGRLDVAPGIRSAALDLDAHFSDYGQSFGITAPANPKPLDVNRLLSLGRGP